MNGEKANNSQNAEIYATALSSLIGNGIEVDKNLRQPSYYTWLNLDELKIESFYIISDLLSNQKIPHWLSQRIAWYYSNKYFQEIVDDLSLATSPTTQKTENEMKSFNREKLVIHLRKSISNVIKEWWNEKKTLGNQNSLVFSFNKTNSDSIKPLICFEYGLKNKRRIMEDKTAIYENIDILNIKSGDLAEDELDVRRPHAMFGVFDGHCGADCAQYVSTHLPIAIIKHKNFTESIKSHETDSALFQLFTECFRAVNVHFTVKAREESIRSGTTACVCLLTSLPSSMSSKHTHLHVAWCGDTQLILVKQNGQISFVSDPHKPNSDKEKRRIEDAGGSVSFQSSAWRVNGSLAVARSFGDLDYQTSGVICDPDFRSFHLDGTEDYLIIGCDGLWEGLSNMAEMTNFVYEQTRASGNVNVAELLVKKAKENGSNDNITAVFVLLRDSLMQISKPQQ